MLTNAAAQAAGRGGPGAWAAFRQRMARADGALLGIAGLLAAMLALDASTVWPSLQFTLHTLWTLSPYFLTAFAFSAYMQASNADMLVTSVFRGRPLLMIFAAAFFGAWSPFCSCSVVPLIAVLLRAGMPLSAIMAFWISSPIISPGMYVLTGAVLGYEFATAKLVAAIVMGLGAGGLTLLLEQRGWLAHPLRSGPVAQPVSLGEAVRPTWAFWREGARIRTFKTEFVTVAVFLTKWMAFAFLLESLLLRYTPASLVAQWLGAANAWSVPLSVLIGIPAYVNGVAAVPLMSALIGKGMTEAAAMAFLLAGSVTSIPAMSAVYVLVRRRVFAWYVAASLLLSYLAAEMYHLYLLWVR